MVQYVIACSDEELSVLNVDKLAQELARNRCTLSRDFKKSTNLLLKDYIIKEKIMRVTKVIESSDSIRIEHIAQQFGFKIIDVFRKHFKNFHCVTPCQYRKLKRGNKKDLVSKKKTC